MELLTSERLERAGNGMEILAGSLALAQFGYQQWARNYEQSLADRMPPGGHEQSTLPFYETFYAAAEEFGIHYVSSGGLTKQALRDPETEFDPDKRQFIVAGPRSYTMQTATMFRPDHTVRDIDERWKGITIGGEYHVATDELARTGEPSIGRMLKQEIQGRLDDTARSIGMGEHGLELSLFPYDGDRGNFRPHHYATFTQLAPDGESERVFTTAGPEITVPVEEEWTCIIDLGDNYVEIPADAPGTHLGRTLVRAVVPRDRDLEDVRAAVSNIKRLCPEAIGPNWKQYVQLRGMMDTILTTPYIVDRTKSHGVATGLGLLLARPFAARKSEIESSTFATAIRDPESPIGKIAARVMNAMPG